MTNLPRRLAIVLVLTSACGSPAGRPAEPIPGLPTTQQRQISRGEFKDTWPFVPGIGTLGCDARAVAFRAQGVTYALNDAARSRGYADVTPIVVTESAGPSNPLGRMRQDERMQVFAEAEACRSSAAAAACRDALGQSHHLTAGELSQIDAEGRERSWPPLSPPRRSLKAVIDAGFALCSK